MPKKGGVRLNHVSEIRENRRLGIVKRSALVRGATFPIANQLMQMPIRNDDPRMVVGRHSYTIATHDLRLSNNFQLWWLVHRSFLPVFSSTLEQ